MNTCENCGAQVPHELGTLNTDPPKYLCCEHCAFNPLGCRCAHGEYGVAETERYWYDEDDDEYTYPDCPDCGGEFWDGGTSCICDDWEDENDYFQDMVNVPDDDY